MMPWLSKAQPSYVSGRLAAFSVVLKGLRAVVWFPLAYGVLDHINASWQMWVGFSFTCLASFVMWLLDNAYDVDGNGE